MRRGRRRALRPRGIVFLSASCLRCGAVFRKRRKQTAAAAPGGAGIHQASDEASLSPLRLGSSVRTDSAFCLHPVCDAVQQARRAGDRCNADEERLSPIRLCAADAAFCLRRVCVAGWRTVTLTASGRSDGAAPHQTFDAQRVVHLVRAQLRLRSVWVGSGLRCKARCNRTARLCRQPRVRRGFPSSAHDVKQRADHITVGASCPARRDANSGLSRRPRLTSTRCNALQFLNEH